MYFRRRNLCYDSAASEQEVLKAWEGLGYYRRARFLHRAAQALVAEGHQTLPADHAALRALPGFGAYTAAAVGSIASRSWPSWSS